MKKFDESQAKFMACVSGFVAIVAFVAGGYFDTFLPGWGVMLCSWLVGIAAVLANVCLSYAFTEDRNSEKKFTRDDLATFSSIFMAYGFGLGMVMMLLYVMLPYNNQIVPAVLWATAGPMSLGLLGITFFFLTFAIEAIREKEWWQLLQTAGMTGLIAGMAVAVAALTLIDLSEKVFDVVGPFMLISMCVAFGSVLAQAGIAKLRRA